jgi:hypothetical protein
MWLAGPADERLSYVLDDAADVRVCVDLLLLVATFYRTHLHSTCLSVNLIEYSLGIVTVVGCFFRYVSPFVLFIFIKILYLIMIYFIIKEN